MILGTTHKSGAKACARCGKLVKSDKENYCFVCGNPLKDEAVLLELEKEKAIRLELLLDLGQKIKDPISLNILLESVKQAKD